MWLVGGKRLSRRSRAMRSESIRRRNAAIVAANGGSKDLQLGPTALLQSTEPVDDLPTLQDSLNSINEELNSLTDKELAERKTSMESIARDSGVNLDNHDSAEESNFLYENSIPANLALNVRRNEKCFTLSSSSTISENLRESGSCATPTPPPSPESAPGTPRVQSKFQEELSTVCSEPDLRASILVTSSSDSKRRSTGSTPDDYYNTSPTRKPKKRVTIA